MNKLTDYLVNARQIIKQCLKMPVNKGKTAAIAKGSGIGHQTISNKINSENKVGIADIRLLKMASIELGIKFSELIPPNELYTVDELREGGRSYDELLAELDRYEREFLALGRCLAREVEKNNRNK